MTLESQSFNLGFKSNETSSQSPVQQCLIYSMMGRGLTG